MRRRWRPPPPGHRLFSGAPARSPGGPAVTIGYDPAMWLTLLHGGTAALFLAMTASALFHARWARRLPPLAALGPPPRIDDGDEGLVLCSIVVAARDEEARVEATVCRLLAQRGVRVEVIVVDDRSTDGTGAILRRLAAE